MWKQGGVKTKYLSTQVVIRCQHYVGCPMIMISIDTRVSCQTKHGQVWWWIGANHISLFRLNIRGEIWEMRRSDNLTLPYPYYRHFHHETHTFNQDMGKLSDWWLFCCQAPLLCLPCRLASQLTRHPRAPQTSEPSTKCTRPPPTSTTGQTSWRTRTSRRCR